MPSMLMPGAPQDVPLPFDRSNGNRTYTHLFGDTGADATHKALNSAIGIGWPSFTHLAGTMEIKLGQPPWAFDALWSQLQELTGPRPHPIWGEVRADAPRFLGMGAGMSKIVFIAAEELRWRPILEVTVWKNNAVLLHRMIPYRFIQSLTPRLGDVVRCMKL